jgi:hypothetical protein
VREREREREREALEAELAATRSQLDALAADLDKVGGPCVPVYRTRRGCEYQPEPRVGKPSRRKQAQGSSKIGS